MTIRQTRLTLQLTQAQMAAELGIGHSTYARFEGYEARGQALPAWVMLAVNQLSTERTEHGQV